MEKWKLSFFILLSANFLFFLTAAALLFLPGEKPSEKKMEWDDQHFAAFKVETNKQSLTKLINDYLKKEADNQPLTYQVNITDEDVKLYGSLIAFGRELDMIMAFEPHVTKDGNVILLVKNLSVGKLSVPVAYVLKYIKSQYQLPKEVVIDSQKRRVIVDLNELTLQNGSKIRAETIDLKKGVISATLFVRLPLQ